MSGARRDCLQATCQSARSKLQASCLADEHRQPCPPWLAPACQLYAPLVAVTQEGVCTLGDVIGHLLPASSTCLQQDRGLRCHAATAHVYAVASSQAAHWQRVVQQ